MMLEELERSNNWVLLVVEERFTSSLKDSFGGSLNSPALGGVKDLF